MIIPLNVKSTRTLEGLAAEEEKARMAGNIAIRAILETHDVDIEKVASVKREGSELHVTMREEKENSLKEEKEE